MASKRLLDKRREVEAAEKQGKTKGKAKEPAAKKKPAARKPAARKRKSKAPERKRIMWGVFSGALKEEGRFKWNEKDQAEEKLALLRSKSKKLYFIQPIKETIFESGRPVKEAVVEEEEEVVEEVAAVEEEETEEEEEEEEEEDDDE